MIIVAPRVRTSLALELGSGTLVRVHHRIHDTPLRTFQRVTGRLGEGLVDDEPDSVVVEGPLETRGQATIRDVSRALPPHVHPFGRPLFGTTTTSVPCWTRNGESPSLTVLPVEGSAVLGMTPYGLMCSFRWNDEVVRLPCDDRRLARSFDWAGRNPIGRSALTDILGFRPDHALVQLSNPVNGHCYKVVSALLP